MRLAAPSPAEPVSRRRLLTVAASLAGHIVVLGALLTPRAPPPPPLAMRVMTVRLVAAPPKPEVVAPAPAPVPLPTPAPTPTPKPEAAATPAPAKAASPTPAPSPAPPRRRARPAPAATVAADAPPAGEPSEADGAGVELSAAQLAGAARAGSGPPGGGGRCDMPAWLQAALRKDPLVQAAVADAHGGKPIVAWNGDWVRRPGQDGDGLAVVREAIMWEVAFAPPACRAQSVRGLVLISLDDGPGAARLVVGAGQWRWSDLLFPRARR